jgi:hypothetical protein
LEAFTGAWELAIPMCSACEARLRRARLLWVVGRVALVAGAIIALYLGARALGGVARWMLAVLGGIAVLAFAYTVQRGERVLFERLFAPLWVSSYHPRAPAIALSSRNPDLLAEVRALSGEVGPEMLTEKDRRLPGWWRRIPRWAPPVCAAAGAAIIALGTVQYFALASMERFGGRVRVHLFEKLAYALGGKIAVLSLSIGAGAVLLVAAAVLWRWRRRAQRTAEC